MRREAPGGGLEREGNAFAIAYYQDEGPRGYLADYESVLGGDLPSLYHVEDSWGNFEKLAAVIDRRYLGWKRKSR